MFRAFPVLVLACALAATAVGLVYAPPGELPEEAGPPTIVTTPPITTPTTPPTPPTRDPPPPGEANVALRVWAREGSLGGAPMPVDARIRATNVWGMNGWFSNRHPEWEAMLAAMEPGALRWPAGHPSQQYCFSRDGERAEGCATANVLGPAHFDAFVAMAQRVGAQPLVGVNVKTGSPANAADLVRYLNVEKGFGVTWFHLGNEPDLGGDVDGLGRLNAAWPEFVRAMRAVDPSIRFVGPEVMTGADVMGIHGRMDWMQPFLQANGASCDAISWHLYPLDSEQVSPRSPAHPTAERLVQWWTPDWQVAGLSFIDVASAKLRADRDLYAPDAEIWVTELGPDSGAPGARGVTEAQVAAVWFADALGRFAEQGTHAVFQFAFDHYDDDDELSLVNRLDGYDPLPPWYVYWLHAQHWGTKTLRTNSTDDASVSVHASLRPDGKVALMLVNKGFEAEDARLVVDGFAARSALAWTLAAPSPSSLDATVNGKRVTAEEVLAGSASVPGVPRDPAATWKLPAMSVTFVVLSPS